MSKYYPPNNFVRKNFFTKKDISECVACVSTPTFNKLISTEVIPPPTHIKNTNVSTQSNARAYYSMADAMRISIILYGSIQMEKITKLAATITQTDVSVISTSPQYKTVIYPMIKQAFNEVRQEIVDKATTEEVT